MEDEGLHTTARKYDGRGANPHVLFQREMETDMSQEAFGSPRGACNRGPREGAIGGNRGQSGAIGHFPDGAHPIKTGVLAQTGRAITAPAPPHYNTNRSAPRNEVQGGGRHVDARFLEF